MAKLTADALREMYLKFFESKGHTIISGASVIPENDPTVLFTTAGMHPLVPYLLGEPHPAGRRLTDVQKCVRTGDIDAVGDSAHLTFFEMLGNWSLGDYFKKEAIAWSFEFLTTKLGLKPEDLYVTVFKGEDGIPRDDEAIACWKAQGIPESHIFPKGREDNWWGPAGVTGPCGPDTEMFLDTGKPACGPDCGPGCHCGKYMEIWNDVFMQYNKTAEGTYEPLKQHNVDTGMGVERTICMINGYTDVYEVYESELFLPLLERIRALTTNELPEEKRVRAERIIADHMRTATIILGDPKGGVKPGNVGANYVLRRLIRRAVRYGMDLGLPAGFTAEMADLVIGVYKGFYPDLLEKRDAIVAELTAEESRFAKTLAQGRHEFEKVADVMAQHGQTQISGKTAFKLYDTYGFPLEITQELAAERGMTVDADGDRLGRPREPERLQHHRRTPPLRLLPPREDDQGADRAGGGPGERADQARPPRHLRDDVHRGRQGLRRHRPLHREVRRAGEGLHHGRLLQGGLRRPPRQQHLRARGLQNPEGGELLRRRAPHQGHHRRARAGEAQSHRQVSATARRQGRPAPRAALFCPKPINGPAKGRHSR